MEPEFSDFPKNISGVHGKILKRLWSMEWVSSENIKNHVNQSEWARRTRELRKEFGYLIEEKVIGGKHFYRLASRKSMYPTRRRPYFTKSQKEQILKRYGPKCAICKIVAKGNTLEEVGEVLMWDHKIPFDRLGETEVDNGQPLCRDCNNLKKQACGTCMREDCNGCLFAYPERSKNIVVLEMDKDTMLRIRNYATEKGLTIPEAISRLVKTHLAPVPVEEGSWTFR